MPSPLAPRRAFRSTDDRWLGGVASGLAEHIGLPVLWVRMGLLALIAFGGFGAVLYAGLWLFLPARRHTDPLSPGLAAATRQGKRGGRREGRLADYGPLVAVGAIAIGVLLAVTMATGQTLALGPLLLAGAGVGLLWWQADEAQRQRWLDPSRHMGPIKGIVGGGGWRAYLRIGAGLLLLVAAITLFSLRSGSLSVALNVGLAAAFGIIGLGFMVGPWLFRLSADLSEEREARVRSEERADVAAHLHDSVLQTLALIQRSAGDADDGLPPGARPGARPALVAVRGGAAKVPRRSHRHCARWLPRWRTHTAFPSRWSAWATCRSPTTTGRWCSLRARRSPTPPSTPGPSTVDVYAEATAAGVEVFVRDRGAGFDPDRVADDRHGVRSSIIGRMQRHGGDASVRSTPGEGTEVRLSLPFARPGHQDRPRESS